MQIVRYTSEKSHEWDKFIESSRNGTFLFLRAYMDYHSDRFQDHSLMYYSDKGKLLAVMAANEKNHVLYSHQGLTYGGFILATKTHCSEVEELFTQTISYLKSNGFTEWYYKQMPTIYHKLPSQEDEYWLWRHGAVMTVCNLATSVLLNEYRQVITDKCRKRRARQSEQYGFYIDNDGSIDTIWSIIEESLMAHHNARPIHSLDEMKLLHSRLPENIKTLVVRDSTGKPLAGAVLYLSDTVVHVQYAHATLEGYEMHVMDYLYFEVMNLFEKSPKYKYFDFGTSNEDAGRYLNENLVSQKEGFGGRGIAYKTYKIKI